MKTKENVLKKRLMGLSITLHMALIIAAMTSFIGINTATLNDIAEPYNYMEINFTNNSTSSGMASAKKHVNINKVEKPKEKILEENKVKVESIEEDNSVVKTENTEKLNTEKADDKEIAASETDGEGEEGKMLSGKALGEMDFDGDGIFGRKVIYHAPIKKLAEQNGRIAINMGINRAGKVVAVAFNKQHSTITDKDLVIRALKMATQYRFESDYTAPEIQYGRYTFIFDIKL